MFYQIDSLLSEQDLRIIHDELANIAFEDGVTTAGLAAKRVKKNLQAPGFRASTAHKLVLQRIKHNERFSLVAAPLRISDLLLSKYQPGMEYGLHMDNPLMQSATIRTDLAFTLFLDDPATYEGGELIVEDGSGVRSFKLSAGSMIIYPACHTHRVAPIRAGQRHAIIGWVQSVIRDPRHRDILHDLSVVRKTLFDREGQSAQYEMIGKSISNLLRLWAEN